MNFLPQMHFILVSQMFEGKWGTSLVKNWFLNVLLKLMADHKARI
jgi:hypothetical protein